MRVLANTPLGRIGSVALRRPLDAGVGRREED